MGEEFIFRDREGSQPSLAIKVFLTELEAGGKGKNKRKLFTTLVVIVMSLVLLLSGCAQEKDKSEAKEVKPSSTLILATTTSTQDSGLLDGLLPKFADKYNVKVKVIAVGTGKALEMGRRGDADVLLVHSPEDERKLVAEGYGTERIEVMHNDFVIVGPSDDPAVVKDVKKAAAAFKKIGKKKANFVTRGDDSGTHKKELKIWEEAGIKPQGSWYFQSGQGMEDTLRIASEKGAYILSDRGTFLAQQKNLDLVVLVEKDPVLFNQYAVILINPKKFPKIKYDEAKKFVEFLVSPETQKLIGEFGVDKYGQPLFTPDVVK